MWIVRTVDLRQPAVVVGLNTTLLVSFLLVYLLGDTPSASAITTVFSLILALFYAVHVVALTVFLVTQLISAARTSDPEQRIGRVTLVRVFYGLFLIITMYALLQAVYLNYHPDAYIGISAFADRGLRLRRMYFHATVTAMSLGTGAIIAGPDAEAAFVLIALNSVHAYLFNVVIVAMLVAFLTTRK